MTKKYILIALSIACGFGSEQEQTDSPEKRKLAELLKAVRAVDSSDSRS